MYRFVLRLLHITNDRIDNYIISKANDGIKVVKNQFITEAIIEKLEKEKF